NELTRRLTTESWAAYRSEQAEPLHVEETNPTGKADATQATTVPITLRGAVVGQITIETPSGTQTLDEEQLRIVHEVAEQTALAADNARLFSQTQQTLTQTTALYNASRQISEAPDLQTIVAALVEGVPNPSINRAVLIELLRDDTGNITGGQTIANWY